MCIGYDRTQCVLDMIELNVYRTQCVLDMIGLNVYWIL